MTEEEKKEKTDVTEEKKEPEEKPENKQGEKKEPEEKPDKEKKPEKDPEKNKDQEAIFKLKTVINEKDNLISDLQLEIEKLKNEIKENENKKKIEEINEKNRIEEIKIHLEEKEIDDFFIKLMSCKNASEQIDMIEDYYTMPRVMHDYAKDKKSYPLFNYLEKKYNVENQRRKAGPVFVCTDDKLNYLFNNLLSVKDVDGFGRTFMDYVQDNKSQYIKEVSELKGMTVLDGAGRDETRRGKRKNKFFSRIVR